MKRSNLFIASVILISAPVLIIGEAAAEYNAADAAVMEKYKAFRKTRDEQTESRHQARFAGDFKFIEKICLSGGTLNDSNSPFGASANDSRTACECPPGNRYLECIKTAKATVYPDQRDIGGRGLILFHTELNNQMFVYLNGRGWVPVQSFKPGGYSFVVEKLGASHTFDVPMPAAGETLCKPSFPGVTSKINISVGYGAVMPIQMDYLKVAEKHAAEIGVPFNMDENIWHEARFNGIKPRKSGEVGYVECLGTF